MALSKCGYLTGLVTSQASSTELIDLHLFYHRILSQALASATISPYFLPDSKYHGQLVRSRVVLGMWEQNGEPFRVLHYINFDVGDEGKQVCCGAPPALPPLLWPKTDIKCEGSAPFLFAISQSSLFILQPVFANTSIWLLQRLRLLAQSTTRTLPALMKYLLLTKSMHLDGLFKFRLRRWLWPQPSQLRSLLCCQRTCSSYTSSWL